MSEISPRFNWVSETLVSCIKLDKNDPERVLIHMVHVALVMSTLLSRKFS